MADAQARLIRCFAGVLRDVPAREIPKVNLTTLDGWDSVTTVTLLTVIQDEFGVEIEPEDIERLTSFDSVLKYLIEKKGVA